MENCRTCGTAPLRPPSAQCHVCGAPQELGPASEPRPGTIRHRWRLLGRSGRVACIAVALLVGVGLVVALVLGPGETEGSSTAGTLAASACIAVVDAGREAGAGNRSVSSFLSVVRSQEGKARSAADMDDRYQPILEAIVSLRNGMELGGDVRTPAAFLASECGS